MKQEKPMIILASASVARRQLLESVFLPIIVIPSYSREVLTETMEPTQLVRQIATQKANIVSKQIGNGNWILAADTAIVYQDSVIGKPNNREVAKTVLKELAGQVHRVLSGVALISPDGRKSTATANTDVSLGSMSDYELEWYLDTEEWRDAAGGYQIQGRAGLFITGIHGSYSNVVGLPLETIYRMLRHDGYPFFGGANWP